MVGKRKGRSNRSGRWRRFRVLEESANVRYTSPAALTEQGQQHARQHIAAREEREAARSKAERREAMVKT
jgi:hypothetical protein